MARGKLYQRKTNSRKEKPLVLIVPEGAETEKAVRYIKSFQQSDRISVSDLLQNRGRRE